MRPILHILLITGCLGLHAQNNRSMGGLPQVTLSRSFTEQWSMALQMESMQRTHVRIGDRITADYRYIRTDLTPILTYRVRPDVSVAVGYMHRFVEGRDIHRSLQQYAWIQQKQGFRLAQRIRTDQTFRQGASPIFRLRYRLSVDLPLQGQSQNIGEFYLVPAIEQLFALRSFEMDGETRLILRLGRAISNGTRLELGIDHRYDGYLLDNERHQSWLTLALFIRAA